MVEEYKITKIKVRVSEVHDGKRTDLGTGYVSKIAWVSDGTFEPLEITFDDGGVLAYRHLYIDEILQDIGGKDNLEDENK